MFRDTVSESLLATLECSGNRVPLELALQIATLLDGAITGDDYVVIEPKDIMGSHGYTVFFLVPPIRTAMRTRSGTEDMKKVGLEVAKGSCKHCSVEFPTFKLPLNC